MSGSRTNPEASVIVSTHNAPQCLCMVLMALRRQTVLPAEVLVADDGSDCTTLHALARTAPSLPFKLVHIHQPHSDFRLARARNNAIHNTGCRFIGFLDQDTLPHAQWFATHLSHVGPRRICTGNMLRLSEQVSGGLTTDSVDSGEFESLHAPAELRNLNAMQRKYALYSVLRRIGLGIKGRPSTSFSNGCACREDLTRVNGFDEEYIGWGQEDDDLGWRLYMTGVQPVPVVNKALVSHIFHQPRHGNWRDGRNIDRYRRPRSSARCSVGLAAHPHPDVTVTRLS
ncbi:MAG: glycosyltransferase [bacterium]